MDISRNTSIMKVARGKLTSVDVILSVNNSSHRFLPVFACISLHSGVESAKYFAATVKALVGYLFIKRNFLDTFLVFVCCLV